jgi:uncharacterized protein YceH (UPF0502 family)
MATDATTSAPSPAPASWEPLGLHERRVLGVLVEKAKTTPDAYPLSLNALVTGCNQKSNRDPVLNLVDAEVEEAVAVLKKRGYVQQITGSGRVDKYRHVLYDALKVDKVQLAVLAELLLRGPQTEAELRTRASRMEPIADLDQLRTQLRALAERKLVVYLSPEGRRGTTVTHGFHSPDELEQLRARVGREAHAAAPPAPSAGQSELARRVEALEASVAQLSADLAKLQALLTALAQPPASAEPDGNRPP